jgi:HAD superfamily hydrolase (TIGR01450 family)
MSPTRSFVLGGRQWLNGNCSYLLLAGGRTIQSLRELTQTQLQRSFSSITLRQQMLDEAVTELSRVKEYYHSHEYNNNNSSNFPRKPPPKILETSSDVSNRLKNVDTVLFDCDGVLYRSPHPTPDAAIAVTSLISQQHKRVLFVTNNGAVSRSQLREKITNFLELDHDLLTDDMMVGSAYSCGQYLKNRNSINHDDSSRCNKVFCIGSDGLCDELERAGFAVIHANDEMASSMSRDALAAYDFGALCDSGRNVNNNAVVTSQKSEGQIDAVVIGHDTDFTYRKLCLATVLLQLNPQASLIATNLDAYDLTGVDGRHIPGNGSIVKAVSFQYFSSLTLHFLLIL